MVNATIIAPDEYVENVVSLCQVGRSRPLDNVIIMLVNATIIAPDEYVENVVSLCQVGRSRPLDKSPYNK